MARMVAASDTRPRRSRNARSSALASRRLRENARSPPRMTRPSRASPSASPDAPAAQRHHTVAARGERAIVGDEHERGAALRMSCEQKIDDLRPGGLVEVAGRLVGDEDGWVWRERAGKRDALLLAAGKLGRIV